MNAKLLFLLAFPPLLSPNCSPSTFGPPAPSQMLSPQTESDGTDEMLLSSALASAATRALPAGHAFYICLSFFPCFFLPLYTTAVLHPSRHLLSIVVASLCLFSVHLSTPCQIIYNSIVLAAQT